MAMGTRREVAVWLAFFFQYFTWFPATINNAVVGERRSEGNEGGDTHRLVHVPHSFSVHHELVSYLMNVFFIHRGLGLAVYGPSFSV